MTDEPIYEHIRTTIKIDLNKHGPILFSLKTIDKIPYYYSIEIDRGNLNLYQLGCLNPYQLEQIFTHGGVTGPLLNQLDLSNPNSLTHDTLTTFIRTAEPLQSDNTSLPK